MQDYYCIDYAIERVSFHKGLQGEGPYSWLTGFQSLAFEKSGEEEGMRFLCSSMQEPS